MEIKIQCGCGTKYKFDIEPVNGRMPVLVCAPQIRAALRRIVKTELPSLPVISYSELGGSMQIQTIGTVDLAHTTAA